MQPYEQTWLDDCNAKVTTECAGDPNCLSYWQGACALTVQQGQVPKPWVKYAVVGGAVAAAGAAWYFLIRK